MNKRRLLGAVEGEVLSPRTVAQELELNGDLPTLLSANLFPQERKIRPLKRRGSSISVAFDFGTTRTNFFVHSNEAGIVGE